MIVEETPVDVTCVHIANAAKTMEALENRFSKAFIVLDKVRRLQTRDLSDRAHYYTASLDNEGEEVILHGYRSEWMEEVEHSISFEDVTEKWDEWFVATWEQAETLKNEYEKERDAAHAADVQAEKDRRRREWEELNKEFGS